MMKRFSATVAGGMLHGFVAVCLLTVPALARAADTATAEKPAAPTVKLRNIVRKQLPQDARAIGLEFKVVALDKAGTEKWVDPEAHSFQIGDSFLVKIKPQDDVYVYVFTEGPKGDRHCLLPAAEEKPAFVQAGKEISLPDDGGWFEFQPPAGSEKLVVIATKEANEKLNLLAATAFNQAGRKLSSAEEAKKATLDAEVSAVRERGLNKKKLGSLTEGFDAENGRQTVIDPPQAGESTTLAISRVGSNAGPVELIVDIPLRSKAAATDK
jgi:hypothetical protein